MIRRLTTADTGILREAWGWDEHRPAWYRQMDAAFNRGDMDDFTAQLADRRKIFIGVWGEQLEGVILIDWCGGGLVNGHLLARRRANTEMLVIAGRHLISEMFGLGMTQAITWVAERHIGLRRMCVNIGLQPDGVVMWRGSYHGKPIKWVRYSVQREQILTQQAA